MLLEDSYVMILCHVIYIIIVIRMCYYCVNVMISCCYFHVIVMLLECYYSVSVRIVCHVICYH